MYNLPNYKSEIDLRKEIDSFFNGEDFGMPKYNTLLHRKLLKDENENFKRCECWNPLTQDGAKGCSKCDGIGTLWEEQLIIGYLFRAQYIKQLTPQMIITPSEYYIGKGDYLYTLKYNDNGTISLPVINIDMYKSLYSDKILLDHNRVEYNMSTVIRVFA